MQGTMSDGVWLASTQAVTCDWSSAAPSVVTIVPSAVLMHALVTAAPLLLLLVEVLLLDVLVEVLLLDVLVEVLLLELEADPVELLDEEVEVLVLEELELVEAPVPAGVVLLEHATARAPGTKNAASLRKFLRLRCMRGRVLSTRKRRGSSRDRLAFIREWARACQLRGA
jgi:hypothetical protein